MLRQLKAHGWDVSVFSLAPPQARAREEDIAKMREICDEVEVVPCDLSTVRRAARLARHLVAGSSFQRDRYVDRAATARFEAMLARSMPDIIVGCTPYVMRLIPRGLWSRTVFDAHNVESLRFARLAKALGRDPRGVVARLQLRGIGRYEEEILGNVARVLATSQQEQRILEAWAPGRVDVVPSGVDLDSYTFRPDVPSSPTILFVGALDYVANSDAVRTLLTDIAPRLRHRDAVIQVVGANPPDWLPAAARRAPVRVEVLGRVPDVQPVLAGARVLAVPLSFGGGTRLKILEGLASGVPIVSTSVGAEGIDFIPGQDIVIADDMAGFAAAIDALLDDAGECARLGAAGRIVAERYSWVEIGPALDRALDTAGRDIHSGRA